MSKLFLLNFYPTFFVFNFFLTFFFQFFPNIFFNFFLKFFSNLLFYGVYSQCFSVYRDKTDSMYLCYEKYDIQQAARNWTLVSCDKVHLLRFSSYCSHHTRREKFNSFPATHNILLYFFRNLLYLIEVLKCCLDGI